MARAGNRILAGAIYAQDSQGTLARVFGQALTTGQTVSRPELALRHRKVTVADVNAVARNISTCKRSVTGYLTGKAGEGRS